MHIIFTSLFLSLPNPQKKMAVAFSSPSLIIVMILIISSKLTYKCFSLSTPSCDPMYPKDGIPVEEEDVDKVQFAINLEFLEAEFFLFGALGYGLDRVAPELAMGGLPPIGAQKANLDDLTRNIITEFAYQEVGHLRLVLYLSVSISVVSLHLYLLYIKYKYYHKIELCYNIFITCIVSFGHFIEFNCIYIINNCILDDIYYTSII